MRGSAKLFIFIAIGILAAASYLVARSMDLLPSFAGGDSSSASESVSKTPAARPQTTALATTCVPAMHAEVSPESLLELRSRARGLAGQRHFAEALTEFHRIGAIDPGFPGLNLDMSESLLQLKRTEEAKAAIDTQLEISECLAKLPPDRFEAYCKAELFPKDGCVQQMQDIRQSAHLEAALVQIELGHSIGSQPAPVAAAEPPQPPVKPSQPPVKPSQTRTTASVQPHTATAKKSGDRSLELGAGTDTQLGAYSK